MNSLQKIAMYRMKPIDSMARRLLRTRKNGKRKPSPESGREIKSAKMTHWLSSIGLGYPKSKKAVVTAPQKREKKQESVKRGS